jgi:excinuclease ABC subunit C
VIDGGKGQLAMAVAALTDLGVKLGGEDGLEVIGLAKERELEAGSAPDRIYRRNVKDSIALRANSPELYVLARIRDEAHRFANTFHQDRRSKGSLRSELDAIPGIGATRRQRLLKHFGSVRAIRSATAEELAKAPGMNRAAAAQVARYFAERAQAEHAGPQPMETGAQLTETRAEIDRDFDANVEGRVGDLDIDAEARPEGDVGASAEDLGEAP